MLSAIIAYGALTLAFVGGMRWVLTLSPNPAGLPGARGGAVVGGASLLIAWAAMILERLDLIWVSLPLLALAHAGAMGAEQRKGLPRLLGVRYAVLRWLFAMAAVVSLTVVWIGRLLGTTIVI